MIERLLALLLLALVAGCASLPGTQAKEIGGRPVEFVVSVREQPSVVFENRLGETMQWWQKVLPEIAPQTTYFAHNRPGYGNSAMTARQAQRWGQRHPIGD